MRKALFLFVVMSCLLAISVSAGSIEAVPPEAPPFLINPGATGLTALEAIIKTPGVTFNSGFANLDAGWNTLVKSPTLAVEYGPLNAYLTEAIDTNGIPTTVDFFGFTGCTTACSGADLTDAYRVSFNADGGYAGWTALTASNYASDTVPEPTTFALLGIGLLGLGVARRKHVNARK